MSNKEKTMVHEDFVHDGTTYVVQVSEERVDNRKDKVYAQYMRSCVMEKRSWYAIQAVSEAVKAVTSDSTGGKFYVNSTGSLVLCRKADKPSALKEFTQAEAEAYARMMVDAAKVELDKRANAKLAEKRVEHARHLARQIAERAGELARQRTNFDARLAGLRAEFMATQKTMLDAACDWARAESAKLAEPIEPKVLKAAIAHADECLRSHEDNIFHSTKTAAITPEEVL